MKPTLLILAAGIGSRYGGLKQVDGMGPGGEAILEFSIFDAMRAGFGKVVFVIRRDIEAAFREKIGRKIEARVPVEYAFQEKDTALDWLSELPHREKPWGTGHAILSAKDVIHEPFAAINADDYYGPDAFQVLAQFLQHDCTPEQYALVAYRLANTLSENGAVARGVCAVDETGWLVDVTERTKIERHATGIAHTFDDGTQLPLSDATPVSMNFWGFHHSIFPEIESQFRTFVQANMDKPKAEFYIPSVVNKLLYDEKIRVRALNSESQWYGVTYPDDKTTVQNALTKFVADGIYPHGLVV